MQTHSQNIETLQDIFKDAEKKDLHKALRLADNDINQAIEIYLERRRNYNALKQTKITQFIESDEKGKYKVIDTATDTATDSTIGQSPKRQKIIDVAASSTFKFSTPISVQSQETPYSINNALKWSPGSTTARKNLPVLLLHDPVDVSHHTPCTLLLNVLPQELATSLLLKCLEESPSWYKYEWYLFDRLVQSTHTSAFYVRKGEGDKRDDEYYFNGKKMPEPRFFSKEMEEARLIIMDVVNKLRETRQK